MSSDFDYSVANPVLARTELALTRIELQLQPNWGTRPPDESWLSGWIREKADGRPFWKPVYQLNHVEGRKFRGTLELEGGAYVFGPAVGLGMKTYGREARIDELAMIDLEGWEGAPAEIDQAIAKEPGRVFARHMNYGHLVTDWTGSFFFKNSTGTKKYANPRKKKLGQWYNAIENQGAVSLSQRLNSQFQLLHDVKGVDGEPLGLGKAKRYVWVPTGRYRAVELVLQKLLLVPDSNGVVSGGGNTSSIYGDAIPVEVPWLRSDALVVAATPPDEKTKPFVRLRGMNLGAPQVNDDPDQVGAGQPEFEVVVFDSSSDMYKRERKLGFAKIHKRGYGLGSPHCLNISYDNLATATVDGINYGSLPAGGLD